MITTRNSASGALALAVLIAALGTVSTALSHAMEVESTLQSDIAQQCCKPILESDMLALDRVADGYLYVSELLPGELDCFVDRLIRTNDPVIRDRFRWFIQNDVWELVRSRLLELQGGAHLDDDISERVDDLLAKEYSDDTIFISGYLRYAFESNRILTLSDGARYGYRAETQSLRLGASADAAFSVGTWKIEPYLSASGAQLWSSERLSASGQASLEDDSSYQGAGGSASIAVLRRDEKAKAGLYGYIDAYRDPPPNETLQSHGAGGNLQFREIGGSALSLKATADWYVDDKVSLGDDYFDPYLEILSLYGEAAYMWGAAGVLATYEHNDIAVTDTVFDGSFTGDSGSVLAHMPVAEGYLRAGVGGGHWSENFLLIGGTPSVSSGGEVHAKLTGDFALNDYLHLDFSTEVRGNESDGTFEGWYPSGDALLGASLAVGDLALSLSASASGEHRDLNEKQDSYSIGAKGEVSFAPVDYFRVSLTGGWSMSRQYGYDPYSSTSWWSKAEIGFQVIKAIDLWLTTEGSLNATAFETPDNLQQESLGAVFFEKISLRY